MRVPEALFVLSQRDQQVTWLDPSLLLATAAVAAVQVQASTITVPTDRMLVLSSASLTATPGAGQNATSSRIELLAPSGTFTTWLAISGAGAANQLTGINWSGEVIVPPLWQVRGVSNFNAGAVANVVAFSSQGVLIPCGNVQRV